MRSDEETVDLESVTLLKQSERAVCLKDSEGRTDWWPKSQIDPMSLEDIEAAEADTVLDVTVTQWIFDQKRGA